MTTTVTVRGCASDTLETVVELHRDTRGGEPYESHTIPPQIDRVFHVTDTLSLEVFEQARQKDQRE